jgi:hypothetical protein
LKERPRVATIAQGVTCDRTGEEDALRQWSPQGDGRRPRAEAVTLRWGTIPHLPEARFLIWTILSCHLCCATPPRACGQPGEAYATHAGAYHREDGRTEPLAGTTLGDLTQAQSLGPVLTQRAWQPRRFSAGGAARPIRHGAGRRRLVTNAYHTDLTKAEPPAFARLAPDSVDLDALDRRRQGAGCRHCDSWHPVGMAVRR